jgi:hypothetical protein
MSDVSQGPGWWRASDGKWYAPEQHPNYRPPPPPPPYANTPVPVQLSAPPVAPVPVNANTSRHSTAKAVWWSNVPTGTLAPVTYGKARGTFTVKTDGISWQGPRTNSFVTCPWSSLRAIKVDTVRTRHGRQRSAFGIGPVGMAVVAATAVSNARAAKIDVHQRITLTCGMNTGGNRTFVFLTGLQREVVDAVCMPVITSFQRAIAVARAVQATKNQQAAELQRQRQVQEQAAAIASAVQQPVSTADELRKLAELRDAGVLSDEEFQAQKTRLLSQ